jgi:hypothetical protein
MGILSKEEKEEFLKSSRSLQLKEDFQNIRNNRYLYFTKEGKISLDKYVEFLTLSNNFANHKQKPFRKIEGNNFKL